MCVRVALGRMPLPGTLGVVRLNSSSIGGTRSRDSYPGTSFVEGSRPWDPNAGTTASIGGTRPRDPDVDTSCDSGTRPHYAVTTVIGGTRPRDPPVSVASSFIGGARPRDPAVSSTFMGFWPPGDQGRAGDGLDTHDVLMGVGTGALNGIYVGEGWQPMPGKLAIWQWEFVEMAKLLPEQWNVQWNVRKDDAAALGRRRKQVINIDI